MSRPALGLLLALALSLACRGEPASAQRDAAIARLVDSLQPAVERAAGFKFKSTPRSAMRTRRQIREFLVQKLRQELPPERMHGIESAYRLFGLLPDTLRLESLLVDLYTEQVAGYYDPDSTMLYGVEGSDPLQLRLVLAHELVHALQDQYVPLDSILRDVRSNDRSTAAQAVLEGQATLVGIRVLSPGVDVTGQPEFWEAFRSQVVQQQTAMPVFSHAPLIIRETLIFPYLEGAAFMRWWERSPLADTLPFGPRMPVSTEQIMHPERYLERDRPVRLRLSSGPAPKYSDNLGELEIRVLEAQLAGRTAVPDEGAPLGWGGDRYGIYETPEGPALVWYAVWDDAASADRFAAGPAARLRRSTRPGYRAVLERLTVGGRPAIRYVLAPGHWSEWKGLPAAEVVAEPGRR